jgi:hypothetical protein
MRSVNIALQIQFLMRLGRAGRLMFCPLKWSLLFGRTGSVIFRHIFLVVSRRGSVYFFWLLTDGTAIALFQASEIG